jgi:hypothetical protein
MEQGMDIRMRQEEKYNFVIAIASGKVHLKRLSHGLESMC